MDIPYLKETRCLWAEESEPIERVPYETIRLTIQIWGFGKDDRFVCWMTHIKNGEPLVRTGWIECLGEDHKQEFAHRLQRKAFEQSHFPG